MVGSQVGVSHSTPKFSPPSLTTMLCATQCILNSRKHIVDLYWDLTLMVFSVDILGWIIFCYGWGGGCPVLSRMVSSILGLYLLDANSNPSFHSDSQKCLQTVLCVPRVGDIVPVWKPLTQRKSKCILGTETVTLGAWIWGDIWWLMSEHLPFSCPCSGTPILSYPRWSSWAAPHLNLKCQSRKKQEGMFKPLSCSSQITVMFPNMRLCFLTCGLEISMKNCLVK